MTDDILPYKPAATTRKRCRPKLPALMADAHGVARMLGIGYRTVRTYDSAGKLPTPLRLGAKVLWSVAELREWIAAGCPDRSTWAAIRGGRC